MRKYTTFESIGEVEWFELIKLTIDLPEKQLKEIRLIYPITRVIEVSAGQRRDGLQYRYTKINEFISVNYIPDEWYLVDSGYDTLNGIRHYYNCDQFDGLLDCLEFLMSMPGLPYT